MLNLLKSLSLGGEIEMLRGEELMRKDNLVLRSGLRMKMFVVILRLTMREVMVPTLINLLAQIVGRNIL